MSVTSIGWGVFVIAGTLAVSDLSGQTRAPAAAGELWPAVVSQGRVDPRRDVNFSALVVPESVYVGQQATYQIGVFLSEAVGRRLRRNPEFVPPDVRSMLTYDLRSSAQALSREVGGKHFDVHVFQRALFPLTAGPHPLAPARLTYALPLSNSIFSREETHAARTGALTIIARDPPEMGRPADYSGAVGRLALTARVDTSGARVGNPVTLTVSVSGVGNVSLFPRPSVAVAWGDVVSGAERVTIDSASTLVQGRKDFDWLVTPRQEGMLQLPALRYPYFNPYTEQYEIALTPPLILRVAPGALAARPTAVADSAPRLTLRTSYRGALSAPLASRPALWFGLAIIPIPALALGLRRRPRRERRAQSYELLRRVASQPTSTPREVRRVFAAAVSGRSGVGAQAMTDGTLLVRTLRRAGVSLETAQRARLVLAELDRATYGGGDSTASDTLAARALATFIAIDEEAIPSGELTLAALRSSRVLALFCILWFGGAGFALADDALDTEGFRRGVTFYDSGNYDAAMREFRDIAERVPRAADAWANLGTAGFQANDTATAAIGWQRALRLEPLADDVRDRLDSSPGFVPGLTGDVPPIAVDGAAALGILLWLVGWGALAWRAWGPGVSHRFRPGKPLAVAAIAAAVVVMLGTLSLAESLSGRGHVIVVAPERLRTSPALSAELASEVMTGEAARATGQQGVWSRLRFSDGRTGWMETRRLESLEIGRGP